MTIPSVIINDKGLFGYPEPEILMQVQLLNKMEEAVLDFRDGKNKIPFLKRNPGYAQEFLDALPQLKSIPVHNIEGEVGYVQVSGGARSRTKTYKPKKHDFYVFYAVRNFLSSYDTKRKELTGSDTWLAGDARSILQQHPNLVTIIAGLAKHMLKEGGLDPSYYHYENTSLKFIALNPNLLARAALMQENIQNGLWKVEEATEKDTFEKISKGTAVAVHTLHGYISGDGKKFCETLAGAKLYESAAAAQRSLRVLRSWGKPYENVSLVEVNIQVSKVLEHQGQAHDHILRLESKILSNKMQGFLEGKETAKKSKRL